MKKNSIYLLLLCCLIGCETSIEIDLSDEVPSLVLNSFFNPDSNFAIGLTRSQYVLDEGPFVHISDAEVVLFDDQQNELSRLEETDLEGVYKSDFVPTVGTLYHIEVFKEGYDRISSSSHIPLDPVSVRAIDVEQAEPIEDSLYQYQLNYNISFELEDELGEDYYEVILYEQRIDSNDFNGELYFQDYKKRVESNDSFFEEVGLGDGLLLSDKLFDGSTVGLNFTSNLTFISCRELCKHYEARLEIRKVSKDFFEYKKSYYQQREVRGNALAEPVPVYTNIKNGFGIFAGYQSSFFLLDIPD